MLLCDARESTRRWHCEGIFGELGVRVVVGCWLESFLGVPGAARAGMGGTLEYRYAETLIISYGYYLMVSRQLSIFHSNARPRVKGGFHSTIEH